MGRDRVRLRAGCRVWQSGLASASPDIVAATTAVAAGAILAMLVDTMIPEAAESSHEYGGLITVVGFLLAFILTKLGG